MKRVLVQHKSAILKLKVNIDAHTSTISVAFKDDSSQIVSSFLDGTIKVWKAGAIRLRIASLSPKLTSLAFPGRHAGACE